MYNKILPFLIPLMMDNKESDIFYSQFPKPFKQKKETKNCCKEYNSNDKNEKRKI